jgi:hypothetical protein
MGRGCVVQTSRPVEAIRQDIAKACRDLRLCWQTGNGLARAVEAHLDILWEELRAARMRDSLGSVRAGGGRNRGWAGVRTI